METNDQIPVKQPLFRRLSGFFAQRYEQGAFYLLILWCLLPVIMSINYVVSGALGKYPTAEELLRNGLVLGSVNYGKAISTYQTLFLILGVITFLYALCGLILCQQHILRVESVKRMPWFYLLALFLLWATISSLRSDYPDTAIPGSDYMYDGLVSYFIYGSVFLCGAMIGKEKHRRILLRLFTGVILYMGLIVVVQETFEIPFLNYCFSARKAGVFNQFNHLGYMLCMSIITFFGLFLYDRKASRLLRWSYLAAILFLCYVLVLNNTFGAMLATLVALPLVLIFYLRSGRKINLRAALVVLAILLAAVVCFFAFSSGKAGLVKNFTQFRADLIKIATKAEDAGSAGTDRMALWRETLGKIAERPIMGFGAEGLIGDNALKSGAKVGLLPHNTYLQIAAYMGIVGLIIYLAAILTLLVHHWKHMRELDPMVLVAMGGAVTYMISEFVGCPVFNTEPYFWLFLGLLTATREGEKSLFYIYSADEAPTDPLPVRVKSYIRECREKTICALNRPLDPQSPFGRLIRAVNNNCERYAFILLILWCLLPIFIGLDYLISGAFGRYPAPETLAELGYTLGTVNYVTALRSYQTVFLVFGVVTMLFATLCTVLCRERIFNRQSFRRMPWYYLLALLLGWAVIAALASDYYYHAFLGGNYVKDGLLSYLIYSSVFICASFIRKESYRKVLLCLFTGVIGCLALLMLVQESVDIAFINYCFSARRSGVFNQFNHFGYMLCMAAVCCAGLFLYDRGGKKALRYGYLAGVFFFLYALVVNNTFGAILAALLGLVVVLVFYLRSGRKPDRRAVAVVLILALILCVCFFTFSAGSGRLVRNFTELKGDLVKIFTHAEDAGKAGTERFTLWRDTIQRIRQRPIFGFGPEGFFGKNAITDDKRPHNEYLQIAGYLGIPALLFYLAALITLARHHWKNIRRLDPMVLTAAGATVAYLISAFVGNPVFNTAPYFWMFLGLTATVSSAEEPLFQTEKDAPSAMEKRTVVYTLTLVLILVLLALGTLWSHHNENRREYEDIQTMQTAETVAKKYIDPSTIKDGSIAYYWFDKNKGMLLPTFMDAPAPYGLGSAHSAGGITDFYKDNGFVYRYDEATDYTDRLIVIAATPDPDVGLKVAMNWYQPEEDE